MKKIYAYVGLVCAVALILIVTNLLKTNKPSYNNNWITVEYESGYFENVLSQYNEGHSPWRNDRYEVSKEFLVSNEIEERVLGDTTKIDETNNTYIFETEDKKQIEVHTITPFDDCKIYFVDKYRYLKI